MVQLDSGGKVLGAKELIISGEAGSSVAGGPAVKMMDSQRTRLDVPEAAKACGDCTLCCKVMAIEELAKPVNSWCLHCKPGQGCLIYATRPAECQSFSCLWLLDAQLGQRWKPNRSKLVLTGSEDGIEIRCDPGFPDAWRREPFWSEIHEWAVAAEPYDGTVLVIVGSRMTLVTPHREFDLGVVGSDERIVRELSGTQVVGVKVVKASDLEAESGDV